MKTKLSYICYDVYFLVLDVSASTVKVNPVRETEASPAEDLVEFHVGDGRRQRPDPNGEKLPSKKRADIRNVEFSPGTYKNTKPYGLGRFLG